MLVIAGLLGGALAAGSKADQHGTGNPVLAGQLAIGSFPFAIVVAGRYAYVVDQYSDDLKVIDVSDPGRPGFIGGLHVGGAPRSVVVGGGYAYVVDSTSDDLKVIDISRTKTPP